MKAGKRAGVLLAAALSLSAGSAFAVDNPAVPESPGIYGIGDLTLKPGMTLYLFRPSGAREVQVGQMKVLDVVDGEVRLELVTGSATMQSGDHLELEASAPSEWRSFKQ